jgi:diguanylate cyclase (GGDEF)-like protein
VQTAGIKDNSDVSDPEQRPRERLRPLTGSTQDIRAASQDVLRLMGMILDMPVRIVARSEGSGYRIAAILDSYGVVLQPDQVVGPDDPPAALLRPGEYVQTPDGPPDPFLARLGLAGYIGVPICLSDGQVAGTLSAADPARREFTPAIREALVLLARMLSHEIERTDRERELHILAGISQAFVQQPNLRAVFQELIEQAVSIFEADYCLLHRIDLTTELVTPVAAHGVALPIGTARRIAPHEEASATIQTARSRRIVWIPDARTDPRPDRRLVERFDLACILYVPLVVDDVTQGVLTIAHRGRPYQLNPALLRVAEILANEAGLALRRHQLWEVMAQRQHELAVLNELSTLCTSQLELEPLLRQIANEIRRVVTGPTDCYIVLLDSQGRLQPAAASGYLHERYRKAPPAPAEPAIARAVIELNAPIRIEDLNQSEYADTQVRRMFPLRGVLGVPLIARGKTLGAILLASARQPRRWTREEVDRLQTAANQVALSIANVQLYEEVAALAVHDPLTGIFNRRYLEQKLREEMIRSQRYDRPLSCIMIDVDHFKRVNDTYGHQVGDQVLQDLARRLNRLARSNDVFARYGGEEFTLLLPETGLDEAVQTAERIRQRIAGAPFHVTHAPDRPPLAVNLTASLGVCTREATVRDAAQLLRDADQALYRAKGAGRNCVRYAHSPSLDENLRVSR